MSSTQLLHFHVGMVTCRKQSKSDCGHTDMHSIKHNGFCPLKLRFWVLACHSCVNYFSTKRTHSTTYTGLEQVSANSTLMSNEHEVRIWQTTLSVFEGKDFNLSSTERGHTMSMPTYIKWKCWNNVSHTPKHNTTLLLKQKTYEGSPGNWRYCKCQYFLHDQ